MQGLASVAAVPLAVRRRAADRRCKLCTLGKACLDGGLALSSRDCCSWSTCACAAQQRFHSVWWVWWDLARQLEEGSEIERTQQVVGCQPCRLHSDIEGSVEIQLPVAH